MVKVKKGYVFGAFVCAAIAVGLSITSIATDHWVLADLKPTDETQSTAASAVRYGLWSGVYTQAFDEEKTAFEVTMTCLYGENACAMLCRDTKEERETELQDLVDGKPVEDFKCNFMVQRSTGTRVFSGGHSTRASNQRVFLNAGCYLCTLIFLSISIALGVLSSVLLLWNVVGNPVQTLFSIYSLYYYLAIAACAVLVAIVVWGALFAASIVKNAGILVTLNGQLRYEGNPILDYSYWLNIGSLALYMASFGLLMTRKYLMDNENLIMWNINQGNQVIF